MPTKQAVQNAHAQQVQQQVQLEVASDPSLVGLDDEFLLGSGLDEGDITSFGLGGDESMLGGSGWSLGDSEVTAAAAAEAAAAVDAVPPTQTVVAAALPTQEPVQALMSHLSAVPTSAMAVVQQNGGQVTAQVTQNSSNSGMAPVSGVMTAAGAAVLPPIPMPPALAAAVAAAAKVAAAKQGPGTTPIPPPAMAAGASTSTVASVGAFLQDNAVGGDRVAGTSSPLKRKEPQATTMQQQQLEAAQKKAKLTKSPQPVALVLDPAPPQKPTATTNATVISQGSAPVSAPAVQSGTAPAAAPVGNEKAKGVMMDGNSPVSVEDLVNYEPLNEPVTDETMLDVGVVDRATQEELARAMAM
jgi:hypothetical protein